MSRDRSVFSGPFTYKRTAMPSLYEQHTPESIGATIPLRQFFQNLKSKMHYVETCFSQLSDGPQKAALAQAIHQSHQVLANELLQKLAASTTGSPQDVVFAMTQNSNFFKNATLGRLTVATHLTRTLQTNPLYALSESLYSADMVGAQETPNLAVSAAMYPNGLFTAASKNPQKDLSPKEKLALVACFKRSNLPEISPMDQIGTLMPLVQPFINAFLKTGDADAYPWETEFAGFEDALCTGLCLALQHKFERSLLTLAMSIAEKVDGHEQVIHAISTPNMVWLIGPTAYPDVTIRVTTNTQWKSAITARLDAMDCKNNKNPQLRILLEALTESAPTCAITTRQSSTSPTQTAPMMSAFERAVRELKDCNTTPITLVPNNKHSQNLGIGTNTTRYPVIGFTSNTPATSPKNALQALLGTPTIDARTTTGRRLFNSVIDDATIQEKLHLLTTGTTTPTSHAQEFLRKALSEIVDKENAPIHAETASTFIGEITQDPNRPMSPNELLLIAAMLNIPLVLILGKLKNGTYMYTHSDPSSTETPLLIQYHNRNQAYIRWAPPEAITTLQAENLPIFGATFGAPNEKTANSCWLEAVIYSASYDPQQILMTKLKTVLAHEDSTHQKDAKALAELAYKRPFFRKLHDFLEKAATGSTVTGITELNQMVQALYFNSKQLTQQDPTDLLRKINADLSLLLGEVNTVFRTSNTYLQDIEAAEADTQGSYQLDDGRFVTLLGTEYLDTKGKKHSFRKIDKTAPLIITLDNSPGKITPDMLVKDTVGNVQKTGTNAIFRSKTQVYNAEKIEDFSDECHITVHRPYPGNGALGTDNHLCPPMANGQPYIDLPATIGDTKTHVRYTISQIIAHAGASADRGHYTLFFQPDPQNTPQDWYIKTKNGGAATKLPNGYRDVQAALRSGKYTYTCMGVKGPSTDSSGDAAAGGASSRSDRTSIQPHPNPVSVF